MAKGISSHFRREAKIMIGFFVVTILVGILAAVAIPRLIEVFGP